MGQPGRRFHFPVRRRKFTICNDGQYIERADRRAVERDTRGRVEGVDRDHTISTLDSRVSGSPVHRVMVEKVILRVRREVASGLEISIRVKKQDAHVGEDLHPRFEPQTWRYPSHDNQTHPLSQHLLLLAPAGACAAADTLTGKGAAVATGVSWEAPVLP